MNNRSEFIELCVFVFLFFKYNGVKNLKLIFSPLFSIKLFRDILCFSLYALIAFTCICNVETFLNGNIDRNANMMQSRPTVQLFVLRKD